MKKYFLILFFGVIWVASYAQIGGGSSKKVKNKNTTTTNPNSGGGENPKVEMKPWDWKDYNIKFKVPTDFKVTKSDGQTFVAENGKINLSIYPRKGEYLTKETMESYLVNWANASKVTNYEKAKYIENLKGYHCYYIDGKVGEFPTSVLLMVNPAHPDISIYIWLSYAASEFETAVDILKSFEPLD
jgi:hypothetical protein